MQVFKLFFLLLGVSYASADAPVEQRKSYTQKNVVSKEKKSTVTKDKKTGTQATQQQQPAGEKKVTLADLADKNLYVIDRVEAVVYGPEVSEAVMRSDMEHTLDGRPRTLEEVIFDRLMVQDALKMRMPAEDKDIDNYIEKFAKSMGGTPDDIYKLFEEAGFSLEEGRRRFGEMRLMRQVQDYKVMSKVFVSEKEVKAYYEEHPELKPALYIIEHAFIPAPADKVEQVRQYIDEYKKTGKKLKVHWRELPEVMEADLAEDKRFLTQLELGQITEPIAREGGFELYRLKSKKAEVVVPLQDRYREIAETLRKPKFEQNIMAYRKDLFDNASIVYFPEAGV
jgi:hypothetical protein